MKPLIVILSVFLFLSFTGCGSIVYDAAYQLSLSKVERPEKASHLYGNQKIDSVLDNSKYQYCFEDSLVKILWFADSRQIIFSVENKTENTIEIPWDKAAYMDPEGHSHRIMHSGVEYRDRANPQPPSVIVRKGIIEDWIFPTDNLLFIPGGEVVTPHWDQLPLLPDYETHSVTEPGLYSAEKFENSLKLNIGKTYQVLLPLQIEESVNDYIFIFKIEDVTITKE